MKVWKIDTLCVPTNDDLERELNAHEKRGDRIKEVLPIKPGELCGGTFMIIYTVDEE